MKKGRNTFSPEEASSIRKLLAERGKADANEQKGVRNRLRRLGFYIKDFDQSNKGFEPGDFDNLVARGLVKIEREERPGEASNSGARNKPEKSK